MWLIKSKHEEHYQNDRGETAVIECFPDDTVVLTIRDSELQQFFQKTYTSRKGARIALGRFGKWDYVITVDTVKKSPRPIR